MTYQGNYSHWMHYTPKKTVESVLESNNHLLVQLKRNQPSLHDAMVAHTKRKSPNDVYKSQDIGKRNRIETRIASTWILKPDIGAEKWHNHFKTLIRVERTVDRFDTRKKEWIRSEETSYYLCDLKLAAEQASTTIRKHWGVENKLHYIRDTRFDEDASRIRVNPSIFALLRSFAFNLLRFNKIENISLALYDNALSLDRLLEYKGF